MYFKRFGLTILKNGYFKNVNGFEEKNMEFYNISTHMEIQTQSSSLQIWFWDGSNMVKKGTLSPNSNWLVTKYAIDSPKNDDKKFEKVYYQVASNQYTTVVTLDNAYTGEKVFGVPIELIKSMPDGSDATHMKVLSSPQVINYLKRFI